MERASAVSGSDLRASAAADLLRGIGVGRWAAALSPIARSAVGRFVADLLEMDAAVGASGLAAAADVLLPRYAGTVTIRGAERVPATGPLVVAANHAGVTDGPALWRLLAARDDLRVIALDRPILRGLPHTSSRLFTVEDGAEGRPGLVRRIADHLREGGAVLTFPAGTIEPDPALRPADAHAALDGWGRSIELFVRLAPQTTVVPVAVSGVISQRMLRSPIARRRATPEDRELAAATLQVLLRDRSVNPVVSVGEPLRGNGSNGELRAAMAALLDDSIGRRGGEPAGHRL